MFESNKIEPYRPLFILGLVSSLLGIFVWLFFNWGWIHFYPKAAHSQLMVFAFFMSFITGFLMTAVPRMTGTEDAQDWEVFIPILFSVCQWTFALRMMEFTAILFFSLQLAFILFFILRRFFQRDHRPPAGFIFIPFAFLLTGFGLVTYFFGSRIGLTEDMRYKIFYLLSGQAFIYNLILGLGSRLVPTLCRLPNALSPDIQFKDDLLALGFFALTINLTFVLSAFQQLPLFSLIRSLLFLIYTFRIFKVHVRPIQWGYLALGIRLSLLFLFLGDFLLIFFPSHLLLLQHFIFIGGFALITLLISIRVTLAHSGQSLEPELKSKSILFIIFFIVLATLFRINYALVMDTKNLILPSILFVIAILIWLKRFFKFLWPG